MIASFFSISATVSTVVLAQTLSADSHPSGTASTNIIPSTTVSATYTNPTCDAGYIVDHCLALTTFNQQDCAADDYACQCITYQAIDTCFDNCPSDPRQHTYAGMIAQYCALARLPTTNTAVAPATSATATNTRIGAKETSTSDGFTPSPTPNTGASLAEGISGAMAAVAGVMAAVV